MTLPAGARLGPYEVVAPLGAGGMGEVYRAHDTRLKREVAIKVLHTVLPSGLAVDVDRLRRFEQEARATATLNHSNILAVYDVGTHDAAPYLVTELLEGETLRERLRTRHHSTATDAASTQSQNSKLSPGGLPPRKAIDCAIQIAHGLTAAHEKGIIHRDLKPENIFLTADGRVKILDFGLAKLTEPELAMPNGTKVSTTPPLGTEAGVLLGTIGYMSPEQVRGRPADHRSDIFAFGAVLYEMLTGRRAFHGDTTADTMTAILTEDPPDVPIAEQHIPVGLQRTIDHCLQKNPSARFQSAGDLAFALEGLSSHSEATASTSVVSPRRPFLSDARLAWTIAAVISVACITALVLGTMGSLRRAPADVQSYRTTLLPPPGAILGDTTPARRLALSPDGRRLAFTAAAPNGRQMLWVRPLDGLVAQPLVGTEGAFAPFWSPDSRSIGFFAGSPDGQLKKIDVAGGPPLTLCAYPGVARGGSWSRDDVIVFGSAAAVGGAVHRVSAAGGASSPLLTPDGQTGDAEYVWPFFLPDGRHFLYLARGVGGGAVGVFVSSLDSSDRKLLVRGGSNAMYAQGHLVFLRESTLMGQPFDPVRLELGAEAAPVAEQVMVDAFQSGAFTLSATGLLAYQEGQIGSSQLVWVDMAGRQINVLGERGRYGDLEGSPDGKRVAVSIPDASTGARDIWLFDVARGVPSRFTFDAAEEADAIWSPDGSRIVFNSLRNGHNDLYEKASNFGGVETVLLADSSLNKVPLSWSPNGQFILYSAVYLAMVSKTDPGTRADLWVLPMTGDKKPYPFVQSPFNDQRGRFSPDGRWVAYASDESGKFEIYVVPFTEPSGTPGTAVATAGKRQISTAGGDVPRWRHDGKELFYYAAGAPGKLMAVAVTTTGQQLEVGAVRPLFDVRLPPSGSTDLYTLPPDTKRILLNTAPEETVPPITLVVNWTARLKK